MRETLASPTAPSAHAPRQGGISDVALAYLPWARSSRSRRIPSVAAALVAVAALTACGRDSQPDVSASPTAAAASAAPSGTTPTLPTPERSADPRSPQALADQLTFEAPPEDDPAVQEALDAYADFLRQFVIAQGLGEPDYPPLLARIDPSDPAFADRILSSLQTNEQANEYLLGTFSERVTGAAGDASSVLIDTCTDYTDRKIYSEATGDVLGGLSFDIVRARATMTRPAGGWVLSQYSVPTEQTCA